MAERWGLEYREAHTLSIDPAALEILDREASRRLGVLPLEFGPDGPVFAVAEPSEERFAAVRDLAGDSATFVVVASETLDALLNSKVFSAPNTQRRPTLFRTRTDADLPSLDAAELDTREPDTTGVEAADVEPESPAEEASTHMTAVSSEHPSDAAEPGPPTTGGPSSSTSALESLLTQIRTGAGSLRTQVEHLTESLETTQRELREANEQLAEATRVAEEHDDVVAGLKREIERLTEQLAGSSSLNESMTARLEEVARELMEPGSGEAGG